MKNPIKISGILLLMLLCLSITGSANAGQLQLSWMPPTTYEDGTPLSEALTYKLYIGSASGKYTQTIDAGSVTSYIVKGLPNGTYYFVATAVTATKVESAYSNEAVKAVINRTAPPTGCTAMEVKP